MKFVTINTHKDELTLNLDHIVKWYWVDDAHEVVPSNRRTLRVEFDVVLDGRQLIETLSESDGNLFIRRLRTGDS